MNIQDIPDDLWYYFPLVLGATCKKFNKKINIYNRTIVVKGNPLEKSIRYKYLKKVDLRELSNTEIYILLGKINPDIIYLDDIELLIAFPDKKIKHIYVNRLLNTVKPGVISKFSEKVIRGGTNITVLEEQKFYDDHVIDLDRYKGIVFKKITCSDVALLEKIFEEVIFETLLIDAFMDGDDDQKIIELLNKYPDKIVETECLIGGDTLNRLIGIISVTPNKFSISRSVLEKYKYSVEGSPLQRYILNGRVTLTEIDLSIKSHHRDMRGAHLFKSVKSHTKADPDGYISPVSDGEVEDGYDEL